jgi:hypothetical protein
MRIARPLARGRGFQYAKESEAAEAIVEGVTRAQSGTHPISQFRINSAGDAIAKVGGDWVVLAQGVDDLEF